VGGWLGLVCADHLADVVSAFAMFQYVGDWDSFVQIASLIVNAFPIIQLVRDWDWSMQIVSLTLSPLLPSFRECVIGIHLWRSPP
jgi:hypothetical protein